MDEFSLSMVNAALLALWRGLSLAARAEEFETARRTWPPQPLTPDRAMEQTHLLFAARRWILASSALHAVAATTLWVFSYAWNATSPLTGMQLAGVLLLVTGNLAAIVATHVPIAQQLGRGEFPGRKVERKPFRWALLFKPTAPSLSDIVFTGGILLMLVGAGLRFGSPSNWPPFGTAAPAESRRWPVADGEDLRAFLAPGPTLRALPMTLL